MRFLLFPTVRQILSAICLVPLLAAAPATAPSSPDAADLAGVAKLGSIIITAYPCHDAQTLADYSDPDIHVVLIDGTVLPSRKAMQEFFTTHKESLTDTAWSSISDDGNGGIPLFRGNTVLMQGSTFELIRAPDNKVYRMEAPFTITAVKRADGPKATNGWVVASFHSSINAFHNEAVIAQTKTQVLETRNHSLLLGGGIVVLPALVLGFLLARASSRSRPKSAGAVPSGVGI